MPFQTTQEIFRDIFGTGKSDKTVVDRFFQELADYLDQLPGITEATQLAGWIRNGNEMDCFYCRSDLTDDMTDYMMERAIPFVSIMDPTGHMGYVIRSCDTDRVGEARDYVLESRARYCHILTGEELKEKMAATKDRDKNILFITDLSPEEADVLRAYCEDRLNDNDIGIDEMEDGTFTFSFIAKKALKKKREYDQSLALVLVEAMLAVHGPNRDHIQRQARNHIALENAIGKRFRKPGIDLNSTPAWVLGKDNQYMRIDATGFEYGRAVDDDGDIRLVEEFSGDVSMSDFDAQINSYLARFRDGTYTYDINDAYRHLSDPAHSRLVDRTTSDDRVLARFVRSLVSAVDIAVSRKIANDPIMQMRERWDEKFSHYVHSAESLVGGIMSAPNPMGTGPEAPVVKGFSPAQVEEVQKILDFYDMDLNYYSEGISRLRYIDTYLDRPHVHRVSETELDSKLNNKTIRDDRGNVIRNSGRDRGA